ncbi:MAG: substrate-binding domain-containing protein [Clostridia bacterium]|nr:substrate-binding domain-containing protein [Clostridia bacterium]
MKMKKTLSMMLAGVMCIGMMAGCGSENSTTKEPSASGSSFDGKISFIISNKDEFQSALDQSAKAAAEAKGIQLSSVDCAADQDKENEAIQAAVENGADALIVLLADDTRAADAIEAAGDVPIVFVNRAPQDESVLDDTHIYVGSDESTSGIMQGEMLAEALQAAGKKEINYLMLQGTAGLMHTTLRSEGVLSALDDAGIETTAITEPIDCSYDRNTAMQQVEALIAGGMDISAIDVVIANNDAMAGGAIEALKQANDGDLGDIMVVGIDGTNAGLAALTNGEMVATVFQNAVGQGSASVQAAVNLASGADVTEGISYEAEDNHIWIPFEKITADNAGDYY